jgi:hypothetical protein
MASIGKNSAQADTRIAQQFELGNSRAIGHCIARHHGKIPKISELIDFDRHPLKINSGWTHQRLDNNYPATRSDP